MSLGASGRTTGQTKPECVYTTDVYVPRMLTRFFVQAGLSRVGIDS
jgi:hypothetical protein